jgi:hypothetical protein
MILGWSKRNIVIGDKKFYRQRPFLKGCLSKIDASNPSWIGLLYLGRKLIV